MSRWLKNLFNGLRRRQVELKGTDLHGNRYFESTTPSGRVRRSVESSISNNDPVNYTQHSIPPEWDRWLRGLEETPPTIKYQMKRVAETELMKRKVRDLETTKEIESQSRGDHGTESQGHASSRSFKGPQETTDNPVRSGKDFRPSSWKPSNQ